MPYELTRVFEFSAAHFLPEAGETHRCRHPHGHNFVVEVAVRGAADPRTGWVMDFGEIKSAVEPLIRQLDHHMLNEIPGLENATSERLARWLWERLKPGLAGLARITVSETPGARCCYWGDE
jgi:6-pyruvoyltetrahydropterin/6-carboxytetrahydropterin synthase